MVHLIHKELPGDRTPHFAVRTGLAALLLAASGAALALPVTIASIDRFEPVAADASIGIASTIPNIWGGHQPRIARFADGSVRIIYLTADAAGNVTWHLMRRAPAGGWSQEAFGATTDDVGVLRDPRDDRAYVMAWPNSVPTAYAAPAFAATKVPGSWQVLPSKYRQYGNFGMGQDGTLCVKASREVNVAPVTSQAKTEYACGKFDGATNTWSWGPQVSHFIGLRHTYDYLFPNPKGLPEGLYATSQRDLHKSASNVPLLDPARAPYVYNGTRSYTTGLYSDSGWVQNDPALTVFAPVGATKAPVAKLTDSYVDSKGRVLSTWHKEDPLDATVYGTYLTVTTATGTQLYSAKWPAPLEIYGNVRIFEDAKDRLWLMWSNRGNKTTEIKLYPIVESAGPKFTLGTATDVSKATFPYAIDGTVYFAAPRGGNAKSLYVDAIMNACSTTFVTGVPYDGATCYNTDGSALERVFYMRIRLPD